jgi:hypothetical protein
MKSKHVLEFFSKDPWCVRLTVLVGSWIFSLALVALFLWGSNKLMTVPLLTVILKKFA